MQQPDIAVIDSGINPWHSHVGEVAGGLSFHPDEEGRIALTASFSDTLGHGTAVAGLIREGAPLSRIHALKIFHGELKASVPVLLSALEWAVREDIKLIHLSLGTAAERWKDRLETLCTEACNRGIVILAAARSAGDLIFPSALPPVIGVYNSPGCGASDLVHHPGSPIEFGACGRARSIPGVPDNVNFSGSSFAVARVTGMVAGLLAGNPDGDAFWVKRKLAESAILLK